MAPFLAEHGVSGPINYIHKFGQLDYNSSSKLDDEAVIRVMNNCRALLDSMCTFYGFRITFDDINPTWVANDIMVYLEGTKGVLSPELVNYLYDQGQVDVGIIEPSRLDLVMALDGSLEPAVEAQSAKFYDELRPPTLAPSSAAKRLNDDDASESGSHPSSIPNFHFNRIPFEMASDPVSEEPEIRKLPAELNVQTALASGVSFPPSHFFVSCSYADEYPTITVERPTIPDLVSVEDNSSSFDLGSFVSYTIRNGMINETMYRSFCTLLTSYRWGYARQPLYPNRQISVAGYLVKYTDKYPVGQQPKVRSTVAKLEDIAPLPDGVLYVGAYCALHITRQLREDHARELLIEALQDILPRTGLVGNVIQPAGSMNGRNVVFEMGDKSCQPSDVILRASTLTWPNVFRTVGVTDDIKIIFSALLISLAGTRETVFGTNPKGYPTKHYRWTLFPIKNVSPNSQTRFQFNAALFLSYFFGLLIN